MKLLIPDISPTDVPVSAINTCPNLHKINFMYKNVWKKNPNNNKIFFVVEQKAR